MTVLYDFLLNMLLKLFNTLFILKLDGKWEWSIEILLLKILEVDCYYWDSCENKRLDAQKLIKTLSI